LISPTALHHPLTQAVPTVRQHFLKDNILYGE
jgi:hypothetical protein